MSGDDNKQLILDLVENIPDFPKPGVTFWDMTPLLASPEGLRAAVAELIALAPERIDVVVGMEARGFILAAPVAHELGAGFVPVRKPGKLPGDLYTEQFALEYGHETLTIKTDAVLPGARVLVIDDVLATGGTVGATAALVRRLGAELVHVAVLMELAALPGHEKLAELGIGYSAVVSV
jgi:adenine phosphoribosyltransferase